MINLKIKTAAKKQLTDHFGFFFTLFIPYFIFFYIQNGISFLGLGADYLYKLLEIMGKSSPQLENVLFSSDLKSEALPLIVLIVYYLFVVGISFVCIDSYRKKLDYKNGFKKSFLVFTNGQYFLGSISVYILQCIWTLLWTVCLIIPGIVKSIAYSQAIYIYRDYVDRGTPIRYRDAITKSRQLMMGKKWQYFRLQISFIGWWLLVIVSAGLAIFWVEPYYRMTLTKFYNELSK